MQDLAKKWAYYFLFETDIDLDKEQISNSQSIQVTFKQLGDALLKQVDDDTITPEGLCEVFCALLPIHKEMDELEIKEAVLKGLLELKHDYDVTI